MNLPRTSIAWWMKAVVLVALNLAAGRMLLVSEPWRLAGMGPIALAIQAGLFFLIRARGHPRRYAFWTGFEAGALLGFWSFLYVRVPDSWVGSLWDAYAEYIDELLRVQFALPVLSRGPFDPVLLAVITIFAFLPQLLLGFVAGLLALALAWSRRSRTLTIKLIAIAAFLILHIAAWFAAWKALPAQPPWLPFGVTGGGLMLEFGFLRLFRSLRRSRSRAFWIGFVAAGLLVFWSYLHAMAGTGVPIARYSTYWPGGPSFVTAIPSSPLWTLWIDYTALASYVLGRPPFGTYIIAWSTKQTDAVIYALIILMPHVLLALCGGLVGLGVARVAQARYGIEAMQVAA